MIIGVIGGTVFVSRYVGGLYYRREGSTWYGGRGSSRYSLLLDGSTGGGRRYSRGETGGKAGEVLSSTTDVAQFLVNILATLY